MLIDFVPCTLLKPVSRPDGSGGTVTKWEPAEQIEAAFAFDRTATAPNGVKGVWKVYTPKAVNLPYHSVIRCGNGSYRVTSKDERKTPVSSALDMRVTDAEEWSVPE